MLFKAELNGTGALVVLTIISSKYNVINTD